MTEHHLAVQRTARYYTIGELTDQTKNILFCLHGFGQLAKYFSRKFMDLDEGQTFTVVPEGLSRLYLNGEYDRIGASWLTREDREYEINDFLGYLNTLFDLVLNGRDPAEFHITLLGFSQGAATACRWLNAGHIRADRLILWAGYFPNGLTDMIDPDNLTDVDCYYVYGRQDEYLVELSDIDGYLSRLQTDVPNLKFTAFDGGHRVESDVLKTVLTSR
ncbi:alpha/beta hydrolase [Spirosoma endophyticum]|uniref:Predicted esterase n=1 Tax=Spirosoma endophyticum TaxID=662367 RepID=A0A1I1YQ98_9BACT|nr:phospholipase [Spirosoma endophyticum]SFE21716.1 Predicted esterase [Spirosoma endophyticum]